jgi:REP element-mobilizing transposase RayT
MGRNPRAYDPNSVYHLTLHGIDDRPIFMDDVDRQEFCIRFRRVVPSEGWVVYAACLVDTRYHLLVGPTLGRVSEGMRDLNGGYSKAFNRRHGRRGALFEGRYREWTIHDERHFANTVRYIEHNAVTCGLAESVDDWNWTTANANSPLKVSDTGTDERSRSASRQGV